MNARQLVSEGAVRLTAAGVSEAVVKMEWWASESLGITRENLDTFFPNEAQRDRIEKGIGRLEKHEPLQYVIGHAPFLNLKLATDRRALIPRPETEELVMRVMSCWPLWSRRDLLIADVGTGTGCIAIAIASRYPSARLMAIDASESALSLARENAERARVTNLISFRCGDLLSGVAANSLDAIVSNPPYIARDVLAGLDDSVREFEPVSALDGGADGLEILRRLIVQAFTALKVDGRLWLEIGDDQGAAVEGLMKNAGFRDVEIIRDMYGQNRFAEGIKCFPS